MVVMSLAALRPLLQQLRLTEAQLVAQADDPETVAVFFHRQRELDRLQLKIDNIDTGLSTSVGHPRLGVELLDQELIFVSHALEVDALTAQGKLSRPDADWLKEELAQHLARYHAQAARTGISTLRRRELNLGRQQHRQLRRYLVTPPRHASTILVRLLVLFATLEPGLTASALRAIILAIRLPHLRK